MYFDVEKLFPLLIFENTYLGENKKFGAKLS